MDGAPLNYLTWHGVRAGNIAWLTWGLLLISLFVIIIITGLVVTAIMRQRLQVGAREINNHPARRPVPSLEWIYYGVGISSVVLFATAVWTMYTLEAVSAPKQEPTLTISIQAQQWWWRARYLSDQPSQIFITANEIHIPVGKPVRFELTSRDVIHSFWVPALAGKTDVIPGRTNDTWLEAQTPGTYFGQCAEFCGAEHAKMGLRVVAQMPEDFEAWRKGQLTSPPQPASNTPLARDEDQFVASCGGCHRVRGTLAGGVLGPDLSHLMTRRTLAAGSIPNTPAALSAWIIDPQRIKPGTLMPALDLSGPELQAIRAFLETLS